MLGVNGCFCRSGCRVQVPSGLLHRHPRRGVRHEALYHVHPCLGWYGCVRVQPQAADHDREGIVQEAIQLRPAYLWHVHLGTYGPLLTIAKVLNSSQLTIHFDAHPSFKEGEEETLEVQLWTKLAEAGLLIAPGWYFAATDDINDVGSGHFRISFSNAEVCYFCRCCPALCLIPRATVPSDEEGYPNLRQGRQGVFQGRLKCVVRFEGI